MTNKESSHDIVATLSSGLSKEELLAYKEVGVTWARIHGEKVTVEEAAVMGKMFHEIGWKYYFDDNGQKLRTRISKGMVQVEDGPEKGHWLKTLSVGEEMLLIDANDPEPDSRIFNLRMNYVPQLFGLKADEIISFADGKIGCEVVDVEKEGNKTRAIKVRVKSIRDTEGLFANFGANSENVNLYSEGEPVLVSESVNKLKKLKELLGDDQPDQIAISFVSTEAQALEAIKTIRSLGFTSEILAKIETVSGVKNAKEIARHCVLEVARGDLEEACKLSGEMTLDQAEGWVIKAGGETGQKVIIATHVADSLLKKFKTGKFVFGDELSLGEIANIQIELPVSEGFMIAAETKTTPSHVGIDIVRAVAKTIGKNA